MISRSVQYRKRGTPRLSSLSVELVRRSLAATAAAVAAAVPRTTMTTTTTWGFPVSCIEHYEMSLCFNMFISLAAYRVDRNMTFSLQMNDDDDTFSKDS